MLTGDGDGRYDFHVVLDGRVAVVDGDGEVLRVSVEDSCWSAVSYWVSV